MAATAVDSAFGRITAQYDRSGFFVFDISDRTHKPWVLLMDEIWAYEHRADMPDQLDQARPTIDGLLAEGGTYVRIGIDGVLPADTVPAVMPGRLRCSLGDLRKRQKGTGAGQGRN